VVHPACVSCCVLSTGGGGGGEKRSARKTPKESTAKANKCQSQPQSPTTRHHDDDRHVSLDEITLVANSTLNKMELMAARSYVQLTVLISATRRELMLQSLRRRRNVLQNAALALSSRITEERASLIQERMMTLVGEPRATYSPPDESRSLT
jgi:hypothetical protein